MNLDERVRYLEDELAAAKRIGKVRFWGAVCGLVLLGMVPAIGFARAKKSIRVESADGARSAELTSDGLLFAADGKQRFKIDTGGDWASMQLFGPQGKLAWTVFADDEGTSLKIFSREQKLRIEVAENLLDSGAGVRLYDTVGSPRATFFAGQRGGTSGVRVTDGDRQPRIDLMAEDNAGSVVRVMDSGASNVAEMSVLTVQDAMYRYTGIVPQETEAETSLVPMVYLSDDRHAHTLISPVTAR